MQCKAFVIRPTMLVNNRYAGEKLALRRQTLDAVSTAQRDFWTAIRTGGPPALGSWGAKQEL